MCLGSYESFWNHCVYILLPHCILYILAACRTHCCDLLLWLKTDFRLKVVALGAKWFLKIGKFILNHWISYNDRMTAISSHVWDKQARNLRSEMFWMYDNVLKAFILTPAESDLQYKVRSNSLMSWALNLISKGPNWQNQLLLMWAGTWNQSGSRITSEKIVLPTPDAFTSTKSGTHFSSLQEKINKLPAMTPNLWQQLCVDSVLSGAALWPVVTSEGTQHNPVAWCATLSLNCSSSHGPQWARGNDLSWVQTTWFSSYKPLSNTRSSDLSQGFTE